MTRTVSAGACFNTCRLTLLAGSIATSISDAGSRVGDPLLYDARLISMHGGKMLFKSEERP
jgi:hypothetical protein